MRSNDESEYFSFSGPKLDQISDRNISHNFRESVSIMFWFIMVFVEVAIPRRGIEPQEENLEHSLGIL
jgi:hypothetical protein